MSAPAARQRTFTRAPQPAPTVTVRPVAANIHRAAEPRVSQRSDPAEKEAEATAKRVMRMETPHAARFADAARLIQKSTVSRDAAGPASATAPRGVAAAIAGARGGGSPLPQPVRGFMEARFNADFSRVRVHTGDTAARLSRQVNAHAFTIGSDVFFGRDRFRPETTEGRELLAHELTHTIQQGAATQANPAVQRSEDAPHVGERTSAPEVQRLGIGDALDFFARQANNIPGFRMFTIVLGVNPINMRRVDRSAANILRAVVEFIPGGGLLVQALDAYGVFDRAGRWIEAELAGLGISGASIRQAIDRFLDSLGWSDIFDLGGVWDRARRILGDPIDRILRLLRSVGGEILRMIKDAVLMPLARLASQTRGWDLLCAVLGRNPITGDPVRRNAETLIGGFMRLIGQEEIWQNIQRSGAIARAWAWFQGALSGLIGFVSRIPQMFLDALRELEIADLVVLPRAFLRIGRVFGSFAVQFFTWAGNTIWNLLEIIFSVVAPGVLVYLNRARSAFRSILQNPVGFIGNLVRAALLGLRQFASRFLQHLRASLIGWLTGAMSGANIYIPQAFNLREIVKFILSVLGLTWQNIRQKLVRAIGEPAVVALETTFDIVRTLVVEGPAAAWEKIVEQLTNLREMVMEQIMTFVRDRVIQAAITRLVTSLNPAGAFIQAIVAIYNTIMFFVERMRQIAQVAASVIDSLAAIAAGTIGPAANRIEQTMAGLLTLVISFLARIAGLGRVSDAVTNVVNRVRQPIDRALDRVVDWIVTQARRLGRAIMSGARSAVQRFLGWWRLRKPFRGADRQNHNLYFQGQGPSARLFVATTPRTVQEVLSDMTLQIPNRTSLQDRLDRMQQSIARAPVVANAEEAARDPQQLELQTQVASELDFFATALAPFLGLVANLPPTAVTWRMGSRNRPMYVKAEPMSINPGNTRGSPAGTGRDHITGFALVSKWEQKTGEHTREGHSSPTLRSRVTGTHILSAAFHGPFEAVWNVVLTDQLLNNRMTAGPEAAAKRHYETSKLSYEAQVNYHTPSREPDPEAYTADRSDVPTVQRWIGFFVATNIHVTVRKWVGTGYTETLYDRDVTAGLPPVQEEAIVPLDRRILDLIKTRVVSGERRTIEVNGRQMTFVKTEFSGTVARTTLAVGRQEFFEKLAEMYNAGQVASLGGGTAARLWIRDTLV